MGAPGGPAPLADERACPGRAASPSARRQPGRRRHRRRRAAVGRDHGDSASDVDGDDLDLEHAAWGPRRLTVSPAPWPMQGLPQRRAGGDHRRARRRAPRWSRPGSARCRRRRRPRSSSVTMRAGARPGRRRPSSTISASLQDRPRAGGCGPPSCPAPPWRRGSRRSRRGRPARGPARCLRDLDAAPRGEVLELGRRAARAPSGAGGARSPSASRLRRRRPRRVDARATRRATLAGVTGLASPPSLG